MKIHAVRHSLRLQGFEPDQLLEVVSDTRIEHYLLARATCDAELEHWECGGLSVDVGRYSFPVRAIGAFAADRFCLGYMRNPTRRTWVNGFDVPNDTIQCYPAGGELNYRADAYGQWVAVLIEEDALQAAAMCRLGRPLDIRVETTLSYPLPPAWHRDLDRAVTRLTRRLSVDPRVLESFLALVADLLVHLESRTLDSLATKWRSRQALLDRADAYLRASLSRPFDLSVMAKAIGTSRRSLQRHFAEAYGVTPREWARCMALHRVRDQLRVSRRAEFTVERLARDFGFEHMGRFAEYYRELFDELPSETLAR